MRIEKLDIKAFGKFKNKELVFEDAHEGLYVVYGPNEAGKSTALRALMAWLFGIEERTRYAFDISYDRLRVGGRLRFDNGDVYEFIRRKGRRGTVLNYEDEVIEFDPQSRIGFSEDEYRLLFVMDLEELRYGAKRLLSGETNLGVTLSEAAGGSVKEYLNELMQASARIFKKQGRKQQLNVLLEELKNTESLLKEKTFALSVATDLSKEVDGIKIDIERLNKEIRIKNHEKIRLQKVKRVRRDVRIKRELMGRIENLTKFSRFSLDTPERIRNILDAFRDISKRQKELEERRDVLNKKINSIEVEQDVLKHQAEILGLYSKTSEIRTLLKEIPELEKRAVALEANVKAIGLQIGYEDGDIHGLYERLKPHAVNLRELRRDIQDVIELKRDLEKLEKEYEDLLAEKQEVERALPDFKDRAMELKAYVEEARPLKKREQELGALKKALSDKQIELLQRLRQARRFKGSLSDLKDLVLPTRAKITEFIQLFNDVVRELSQLKKQKDKLNREIEELKEKKEKIEKKVKNVDEKKLEEVRGIRDQQWEVLKNLIIDVIEGDLSDQKILKVHREVHRHEELQRDVDVIADILIKYAMDIQKIKGIDELIDSKKREIEEVDQAIEIQNDRFNKIDVQWMMLWNLIPIVELGKPQEMLEWVDEIEGIQEDYIKLMGDRQKVEIEEQKIKAYKNNLFVVLSGVEKVNQNMSLEQLIKIADGIIKRMVNRDLTLSRLEKEIKRKEKEIKRLRVRYRELVIRIKEDTNWIGLDWGEEIGEKALKIIELIEEFIAKVEDLIELRDQITLQKAKVEEFVDATRRIADLDGNGMIVKESAILLVEDLFKRLKEAQAGLQKQRTLKKELDEIENELWEVKVRLEKVKKELEALMHETGAKEVDKLEEIALKIEEYQDVRERLLEVENRILEEGDEKEIEALVRDFEELTDEEIQTRMEEIERDLSNMDKQRIELERKKARLEERLYGSDRSSEILGLRAKIAAYKEEVKSLVRRYLMLEAQIELINAGIRLYKQKAQDPVLGISSKIFSGLTGGRFIRIRAGYEDPQNIEIVRKDNEVLYIDALSEGTKDQLFMAIRLGSMLYQLNNLQERLPLIMDDVLVRFDDERSFAALKELGEISKKTQVILFTHHKRIAEMATEMENQDVFVLNLE